MFLFFFFAFHSFLNYIVNIQSEIALAFKYIPSHAQKREKKERYKTKTLKKR